MIDQQAVIWIVAAFIAIVTPLISWVSPHGRARRALISDLHRDLEILSKKVDALKAEVTMLLDKVESCERERSRLERENYRLYRELDGREFGGRVGAV